MVIINNHKDKIIFILIMNFLNYLSRGLNYRPTNQYYAMRGGTLGIYQGKIQYEPDGIPITKNDLNDIILYNENENQKSSDLLKYVKQKIQSQAYELGGEDAMEDFDYQRDIKKINKSISKIEKKEQDINKSINQEIVPIKENPKFSSLDKFKKIKEQKNQEIIPIKKIVKSKYQNLDDELDILQKNTKQKPISQIEKIKNEIISLHTNYGKAFETVIIPYLDKKYKETFINNDTNDKLSDKKNIPIGINKFSEQELYIYDLSSKSYDIECKMYDSGKFRHKSTDDDIPLQLTKFGNEFYQPYFAYDTKGEFKLYDVWKKDIYDDYGKLIKEGFWMNNDDNKYKDLYILYYLADGLFTLKINDGDNFNFKKEKIYNGKQLYRPNDTNLKDNFKLNYKKEFYIDNKKLKPFLV